MRERDKTNILTVLENLELMFRCLRYSTNGISGKVQSLALAVEAQSLATKIGLASKRWAYKLPFKEACDVDFSLWHKKVDCWIDVINDAEVCSEQEESQFFQPNADYYIDQFYRVRGEIDQIFNDGDGGPRYYEMEDVEAYNSAFCELKAEFECDRPDHCEEIDTVVINDFEHTVTDENADWLMRMRAQEVGATLRNVCDKDYFFGVCTMALENLSEALGQAYRILLAPREEAYKALFERLSLVFYSELIGDAIDSFRRWSSFAPTSRRLQAFEEKFEKEKRKFFSGKWQEGLETYFDLEDIGRFIEGTDAGKFIYKYRRELSKEEVGQILAGCHKLACYHNEICRLKSEREGRRLRIKKSPEPETSEMEIHVIFSHELRQNKEAVRLFVEILRDCEPDVKRQSGKNWGHVRDAFINLGFIDKHSSGVDFGNAIQQICDNRKACNVEQAIKRYNVKSSKSVDNKDQGFIDFFTEQFLPVKEMVR